MFVTRDLTGIPHWDLLFILFLPFLPFWDHYYSFFPSFGAVITHYYSLGDSPLGPTFPSFPSLWDRYSHPFGAIITHFPFLFPFRDHYYSFSLLGPTFPSFPSLWGPLFPSFWSHYYSFSLPFPLSGPLLLIFPFGTYFPFLFPFGSYFPFLFPFGAIISFPFLWGHYFLSLPFVSLACSALTHSPQSGNTPGGGKMDTLASPKYSSNSSREGLKILSG